MSSTPSNITVKALLSGELPEDFAPQSLETASFALASSEAKSTKATTAGLSRAAYLQSVAGWADEKIEHSSRYPADDFSREAIASRAVAGKVISRLRSFALNVGRSPSTWSAYVLRGTFLVKHGIDQDSPLYGRITTQINNARKDLATIAEADAGEMNDELLDAVLTKSEEAASKPGASRETEVPTFSSTLQKIEPMVEKLVGFAGVMKAGDQTALRAIVARLAELAETPEVVAARLEAADKAREADAIVKAQAKAEAEARKANGKGTRVPGTAPVVPDTAESLDTVAA